MRAKHHRTKPTRQACRTTAIATLVGLAVALALGFSSSALALTVHRFSTSIGSKGSGDGQLLGPDAVAVNLASHDIYVVDPGNNRVVEFSSAGNFIRAFGADVGGAGINSCTSSCVAGTRGTSPGQFSRATFIAVDNSGGASAGDVYVADLDENLISKFDGSGNLITSWGSGGQLDGSTASDGPFGELGGIAVDGSGNLDVIASAREAFQPSHFFKFAQDGSFKTDFAPQPQNSKAATGLGVDPAGRLFMPVQFNQAVEEFEADGSDIGLVSPFTTNISGFGVDPGNGDLYSDTVESLSGGIAAIERYSFPPCAPAPASPCSPVETFGSGHLSNGKGLAVDPSLEAGGSTVYVADSDSEVSQIRVFKPVILPDVITGAATNATPTSATLNGTVNPEGVSLTDCHFEYVTELDFQTGGGFADLSSGGSAPCEEPDAAEIGSGSSEVAVHGDITGLEPGVAYRYRLLAANVNDSNPGSDAILAPPSIDAAEAQNVTATEAALTAKVNPNGFDTSCKVEWGIDTPPYGFGGSYEHEEACENSLGSGSADVTVAQHLSGLSANTTYHWRVLATNARGTMTGADHTFIYNTSVQGLPDGRAYEMVTPDNKGGQPVRPVLVASDGNRFIGESAGLFAGGQNLPSCLNNLGGYYEFHRTESGWQTTPMSLPSGEVPQSCMLDVGSSDLTETLWENTASPDYQFDLAVRHADGTFTALGPSTPTATWPMQPFALPQGVSEDLSHVVWSEGGTQTHKASGDVFTQPYLPFDPTQNGSSPMEYVGTGNPTPSLVAVTGGPGSTEVIGKCGATIGGRNSIFHAMSANGRTVFFTPEARDNPNGTGNSCGPAEAPPVYQLYARIDESETVMISGRSPTGCSGSCQSSPPSDANFEGASADGSKVFFTDTQQLLDSASGDPSDSAVPGVGGSEGCTGASAPGGCNLYLYDSDLPESERLIDASAASPDPRVQGVTRISDDGSHVYFVARGSLTPEPNAEGQTALDGADNLYLFERDSRYPSGRTAFIADLCSAPRKSGDLPTTACPLAEEAGGPYGSLSYYVGGSGEADDNSLWRAQDYRPAETTPDGRFLVFVSRGQLTPDTTGQAYQVFLYDAQTGELTRVSHGERGFNDNGDGPAGGAADAFIVAPRYDQRLPLGIFQQYPDWRAISNDGSQVFFQSSRGLTPKALDGVPIGNDPRVPGGVRAKAYAENVYEWEADGKGSCETAGGCVSLISDGSDISRTALMGSFARIANTASATSLVGTDASGSDVFFSSADQLASNDTNSVQDVYDARAGGGFPDTHPIPCQTSDACHASGSEEGSNPQPSHFEGPEEGPKHPSCAKGFVKRHGACVKRHSRKHHSRHHKSKKRRADQSAHHNRRAGR